MKEDRQRLAFSGRFSFIELSMRIKTSKKYAMFIGIILGCLVI